MNGPRLTDHELAAVESVTGRPSPRNGAGPFPREPHDPTADDLADWQRGAAALARMPARLKLELTDGIGEERARAAAELRAVAGRLDHLRYWPADTIDAPHATRLGARALAGVSDEPAPPLLIGRLDPSGHTILYGTGGSGKGTLTADWLRRLIADTDARVLVADYENHPDEWARRFTGLGADAVRDRVLHVAPLTAEWTGPRGAIWAQADDLRAVAVEWGATFLVVDSIVPACGATDSLKPEAAGQYTGALERIGLPALSLAHATKAEHLAYPFGSVFWHNLARLTWSLEPDGPRALLVNRKANNYARGGKYSVEVTWQDGRPVEVWERPYSEVLSRRIARLMAGQALSVKAIAAAFRDELEDGEKEPSEPVIRKTLNRGQAATPPTFEKEGELWRAV